jgi:hypothetical protein
VSNKRVLQATGREIKEVSKGLQAMEEELVGLLGGNRDLLVRALDLAFKHHESIHRLNRLRREHKYQLSLFKVNQLANKEGR